MNDGSPQPWAIEAAALPIAFAQVREDPRLDRELCATLAPGSTVMMIASGGDTAACLARLPLGRLVLVDLNPAQLALTRCKLHLATHSSREDALALLGHTPLAADERRQRLARLLPALGICDHALGPPEIVAARGPDFCGRYEACFAALRGALDGHRDSLGQFLGARSPGAAAIACDTTLGAALNEAFATAMSLPNLVALFGAGATQNPRLPFACHFAIRTRIAAARCAPRENPFLWQILAGAFPPDSAWDWLSAEDCGRPVRAELEYAHTTMLEALRGQPAASVDFLHLSNILDWLSPDEATDLLAAARHALKRGGRVFLRQLNSSLDIPSLASAFEWDFATAQALEQRDRSFFYPHLHLGRKS